MVVISFRDFQADLRVALALDYLVSAPPVATGLPPRTPLAEVERKEVMDYVWTTQRNILAAELSGWFAHTFTEVGLVLTPRLKIDSSMHDRIANAARKLMVERAVVMLFQPSHPAEARRHQELAEDAHHSMLCALL